MNRDAVKIALLASGLVVLASGCVTPPGQQDDGFMPGSPRTPAMPGAPAHSPMPGYSQSGPPPASVAPASVAPTSVATKSVALAQPGHVTAVAAHQPPAAAPVAKDGVSQVGFFTPAAQACGGACSTCSPGASCGCHGDCAVTPHGYVMQSTVGWNAYGIDPQEFLCDGGDQPPAAIVRRDDSVGGLGPEDTVVHYTTEAGDIEIKESNRVCLYAPRFSSVRKITGAVAGGRAIGLAQMDLPVGPTGVDLPLPGLVIIDRKQLEHAEVARPIDAMRERVRGVPVGQVLQPVQTSDVLAALAALSLDELQQLRDDEKALFEKYALAAIQWELDECLEVVIEDLKPPVLTRDEQLQGLTIYEFPDAGRLRICKLADRTDALPGEIVSFAIRVENVGDSAVDHVVLMDHLVTRLEYVEESQTCSGGAEFTATDNESGSKTLQWKLTDKLRVGESVTIRFQCKVR